MLVVSHHLMARPPLAAANNNISGRNLHHSIVFLLLVSLAILTKLAASSSSNVEQLQATAATTATATGAEAEGSQLMRRISQVATNNDANQSAQSLIERQLILAGLLFGQALAEQQEQEREHLAGQLGLVGGGQSDLSLESKAAAAKWPANFRLVRRAWSPTSPGILGQEAGLPVAHQPKQQQQPRLVSQLSLSNSPMDQLNAIETLLMDEANPMRLGRTYKPKTMSTARGFGKRSMLWHIMQN